jgi:hypothetical protein
MWSDANTKVYIMTEIDFVVGDRVVTSRGIYGTIVSIDESADTSQVNIGSKIVTLYNNQLWSVKNRISVVCYYTDGYENYNRLVTLPKQFKLYDFTKPLDNELLDYCKKAITKSVKGIFTITKIEI